MIHQATYIWLPLHFVELIMVNVYSEGVLNLVTTHCTPNNRNLSSAHKHNMFCLVRESVDSLCRDGVNVQHM